MLHSPEKNHSATPLIATDIREPAEEILSENHENCIDKVVR
jgi:hypothetical protein